MTSEREGVRGLVAKWRGDAQDCSSKWDDGYSTARRISADELESALAAEGVQAGEVEQRARELLAAECPECGGRNGYDVPDGNGSGRWQNCGTCRDDERLHSVNRDQALRAIVAALSQQPEGVQAGEVE